MFKIIYPFVYKGKRKPSSSAESISTLSLSKAEAITLPKGCPHRMTTLLSKLEVLFRASWLAWWTYHPSVHVGINLGVLHYCAAIVSIPNAIISIDLICQAWLVCVHHMFIV